MSNNIDPPMCTSPVADMSNTAFARVEDVISRAPTRMAKDAKKRKEFTAKYFARQDEEQRKWEEGFEEQNRQRDELLQKYIRDLKEVFRADMAYNRVGPILQEDVMTSLENTFVESITEAVMSLSVSQDEHVKKHLQSPPPRVSEFRRD